MRTDRHPRRWAATALALGMAGALAAGCGDENGDTTAPAPAMTTEGAIGGGVVDEYFGSAPYVGEEVTVQGEVTQILSPVSFELAAGPYGDTTALALSRNEMTEVSVGDEVIVTGIIRDFTVEEYQDEYGISDDGTYEAYENERFLDVASIEPVPGG